MGDMLRFNVEKAEEIRRSKRLLVREVAAAGGISARLYSTIANTSPGEDPPNLKLSTVDGIARALGVRPKSLLLD